MKLALITCESLGEYANNVDSEDELLLRFLRGKQWKIEVKVWSDPDVDWSRFDYLLIKSPWDYFDRIDEFYGWLRRVEVLGIPMLNPLPTLRWNANKIYLRDISEAGLRVIPTRWIEQGQDFEPEALFEAFQTDKIIVKPRVSAGAKQTFAIERREAEQYRAIIEDLFSKEACMVQPFLPQIQTEGEWSLIFFNGKYSHCVRKQAKSGDFRVQHYLGGTIHPTPAPAHLREQAQQMVNQFAHGCLYTRVDGLEINGQLWLMELELLEPFLFLFTHPDALENYHRALQEMLTPPAFG